MGDSQSYICTPSRLLEWMVAVGAGLLLCGCQTGQATRTSLPKQEATVSAHETRLAANNETREGIAGYLDHQQVGVRTFSQSESGRRSGSSQSYVRRVLPQGRIEGSLIGRVEFPLGRFLDPHSEQRARPAVDWPGGTGPQIDAFFIEFKQPLMEWPAETEAGTSVEANSQITAYERDGTPFANGTVRRTMRVVGYESISSGGQSFVDAVRLEAQSELTFGWMATIRVLETAWFARGVGLVRRDERYSGRALWLFRFGGASKYELAEQLEPHVKVVAERLGPGPASTETMDRSKLATPARIDPSQAAMWKYLAICFERTGRRLRVSGVAIDWGVPTERQVESGSSASKLDF